MESVSQNTTAHCYAWMCIPYYGEMQFYFHVISSRLKHSEGTFVGSSGVWVNCRRSQMQVRPSPSQPAIATKSSLMEPNMAPLPLPTLLQLGLAWRAIRLTDSLRNCQFSIRFFFFSPQQEYEVGVIMAATGSLCTVSSTYGHPGFRLPSWLGKDGDMQMPPV